MRITAQRLNRATLARQLLLRRQPLGVADAVRRVVALQAQQPASPYLALWNRLTAFDPADLDAAFAGHTLVKATLMRITLHVVHADAHPAMHAAMQPTLRAARLGDPRFTVSGLRAADADVLLPELLEFADRPRTAAEVEAWLGARLGVPPKGVWWALRSFAPLLHTPTGGPWSFGSRPSYVAAGTSPTSGGEAAPDAPQAAVVRAAPRSRRPAARAQAGAAVVANDSTGPWTGVPEVPRSGRSRAASTNDRRIANPCPERGRAHPWS